MRPPSPEVPQFPSLVEGFGGQPLLLVSSKIGRHGARHVAWVNRLILFTRLRPRRAEVACGAKRPVGPGTGGLSFRRGVDQNLRITRLFPMHELIHT